MKRDSSFAAGRRAAPPYLVRVDIRHCRECPSEALRAVLRRSNRYVAVVRRVMRIWHCKTQIIAPYGFWKNPGNPDGACRRRRIGKSHSQNSLPSGIERHHVQSSSLGASDTCHGALSLKAATVERPQKNEEIVCEARGKRELQNRMIRCRVCMETVASAHCSPARLGQSDWL